MKKSFLLTSIITLAGLSLSHAASVTMTNSDTVGNSSFNSGLNWDSGAAPSAGNDYITGDFILRTPADGSSHTFGGNSLTVSNVTGYPRGLLYKGTGATGVITINDLRIDGAYVSHANGVGDVFQLAGSINVVSDSTIYAKQGEIYISAPISGSGSLTIPQSDAYGEDRRYVTLLTNNPLFTGKIYAVGKLRIISEESLGGNPASFTADQLTFNGGWLATTNTFAINDSKRGILVDAGGGAIAVSNPDTNTIATLTITCPITGYGVLTKRGGGVLTLSGNNDFGGLTMYTYTAGSRLNINSPTALGYGAFTLGGGAVAPALLDNTSGSDITLTGVTAQSWYSSFTFLGSSSLDMGVGDVSMYANVTATVSNKNLTVGKVYDDGNLRVLTKQGPGTLTINGGGFYYGNTVINEGVLALTTAATLYSPIIIIASNATLDVSAPGGLVLNSAYLPSGQALTGSGTVIGNVSDSGFGGTVINPGTSAGTLTINGNLTLNGSSTLNFELSSSSTTPGGGTNDLIVVTGNLIVNGSTAVNLVGSPTTGTYTLFQYGGSFSGNLANLTIPPGFALTNTGSAIQLIVTHVPVSLTWRGDGIANVWDLGTTANWIQSGTNQSYYNGDSVTFDDTGSNTPAITLAGDLSPAAVTVNASKDFTFTGGGILSGNLTKNGSGTLRVGTPIGSSGATTISGGTLQVSTNGTLGTGPVTNNSALVVNTTNTISIPGNISGTGTITVLNGGAALSASNSYSGLTVVAGGTLFPRNADALGTLAAGTVVTNGGQLYFDLNQDLTNVAPEALTLGGGTLRRGGANALTFGGTVSLIADATLSVDGGATLTLTNAAGVTGTNVSLTLAGGSDGNGYVVGPINLGTGALTVSGGLWSVAATNTYTGKTFLNGGRLTIPGLAALGPVPGSATPDFVTLNGGVLTVTNDQTFSGGLRGLTVTGTNAGTLFIQNSSTVTIFGDLNGAGTFQKWQGTLVLAGSNPFAGTLQVDGGSTTANDGITRIASPSAIANVTNIVQRNNNSGYSTLQLDGTAGSINLPQEFFLNCRNNDNPNIQNMAGNNTISGNLLLNVGGNRVLFQSDAGLLTISGTNQYVGAYTAGRTYTFTGAGDILVSGPIVDSTNGAPISVAKNGAGTTTLSAANTYSNTTTINDGLLLVSGSINSTGGVSVVGGALGGTGTINDNVTVQTGGSLSPGTSIGTLTINGDLAINGNLAFEVNKSQVPSNDVATVSGNLANTGTGILTVSNSGPALVVGNEFYLFNKAVGGGGGLAVTGGGAIWANNLAVDGSIAVAGTVPTTPTNITHAHIGSTLSLSWPASHLGWILQMQTNAISIGISTNWTDVPQSATVTSTNITIDPAIPTMFFRLRYP